MLTDVNFNITLANPKIITTEGEKARIRLRFSLTWLLTATLGARKIVLGDTSDGCIAKRNAAGELEWNHHAVPSRGKGRGGILSVHLPTKDYYDLVLKTLENSRYAAMLPMPLVMPKPEIEPPLAPPFKQPLDDAEELCCG